MAFISNFLSYVFVIEILVSPGGKTLLNMSYLANVQRLASYFGSSSREILSQLLGPVTSRYTPHGWTLSKKSDRQERLEIMYQAANALLNLRNNGQFDRADQLEVLFERLGVLFPNQPLEIPIGYFHFIMAMAIWDNL